MKTYFIPVLLSSLFIYSCNSSENKYDNKALQDSVIAIHDEVMPLMGGFVRNSIKIDSILVDLQSYKAQNPDLDTAQARVDLSDLKVKLDAAATSMSDWMHEFETEHEGKTEEEVKKYLDNELVRIQKVKEKFNTASESNSKLDLFKK